MKIGIITFHNTNNYGATLQAFALSKFISNKEYDVEIIDYCCEYKKSMYSIISIGNGLKDTLKSFYMAIPKSIKIKNLLSFLKDNTKLTENTFNSLNELNAEVDRWDVLITGSDQVWNYENTGLDEAYFLNFGNNKVRRISYAASFGLNEISNSKKGQISQLLSNLDLISVREKNGVKLVKELTNKKVTETVDPTFLLNKQEWSIYASKGDKKYIYKDYILLYTMKYPNETSNIAYKLSKKTGYKIINVFRSPKDYLNKKFKTVFPNVYDFLLLIKNCKYVVTDSFHGTAMALNFGVGVLSYCPKSGNVQNRLENLLELAELEESIISNYNEELVVPKEKFEYKQEIKEKIEKSKEYLNMALNFDKTRLS